VTESEGDLSPKVGKREVAPDFDFIFEGTEASARRYTRSFNALPLSTHSPSLILVRQCMACRHGRGVAKVAQGSQAPNPPDQMCVCVCVCVRARLNYAKCANLAS